MNWPRLPRICTRKDDQLLQLVMYVAPAAAEIERICDRYGVTLDEVRKYNWDKPFVRPEADAIVIAARRGLRP